jgi:Right handed beta helix region
VYQQYAHQVPAARDANRTISRRHVALLARVLLGASVLSGCMPGRDAAGPAGGEAGIERIDPASLARSTRPPPLACQSSLQAVVDAAPAGAVIAAPPCLARETLTISRPITLDGGGQAEIRGSDVWTDWTSNGPMWVSVHSVPQLRTSGHLECVSERCQWPEQVFIDSRALEQVGDGRRPNPGQFSLDAGRRVVLADDPTGRTVEVTVRARWIGVFADGVTIEGFTMRHAASPAQHGAVGNQDRSGFILQDNILTDTHGAVVSVGGGRDTKILRNDITRGGQEGINGYKNTSTLIQANRVYANNTEGFKPEWEAGGIKLVAFVDAVLDGNEVFGNHGPGLWCDIDCRSITYSNNRVHGNSGPGIFFEISVGADIFQNTIWGTSTSTWPGILVSSSAQAAVHDNVIAWHPVGIQVLSVDRADRPRSGAVANTVDRNTILLGQPGALAIDWANYGSGRLFDAGAGNTGEANQYWFPGDEDNHPRFSWQGKRTRLADFNTTPGGRDGRYLSTTERDRALAANAIPPYQ